MAAILWPKKILKPQNIELDITPRNLRGPTNSSGFAQVVSNSAGMWNGYFDAVPVYNRSMILLWRTIFQLAEGQLNAIRLPIWDKLRAPLPSGATVDDLSASGVPHSDDEFFSDGSGYISTITDVETSTNVEIGEVELTITKTVSGDIESGQRFSVETNDVSRLYQVGLISAQDDTSATFKFLPPAREPFPIGTSLNFDCPLIDVRLADDREMRLPLNFNRQSFPTVSFIEAL